MDEISPAWAGALELAELLSMLPLTNMWVSFWLWDVAGFDCGAVNLGELCGEGISSDEDDGLSSQ